MVSPLGGLSSPISALAVGGTVVRTWTFDGRVGGHALSLERDGKTTWFGPWRGVVEDRALVRDRYLLLLWSDTEGPWWGSQFHALDLLGGSLIDGRIYIVNEGPDSKWVEIDGFEIREGKVVPMRWESQDAEATATEPADTRELEALGGLPVEQLLRWLSPSGW